MLDFVGAKLLSIIEPYQGSNIILQAILLVLLLTGALFLNRLITSTINKNYNRIKNNFTGNIIYKALFPVYKILNIALILSFGAQIVKYMGIEVPIIEEIYVILYLWVVIKVISKMMIKNKLLKKTLIYSAFVIIVLNVLNLYSDTVLLLDGISVTVSDYKISIYSIIKSIVYFTVVFKVALILNSFVAQRIEISEDLNPTIKALMTKANTVLVFIFATILFINILGIDLGSLALFTSALGVGIGFGLQKIVANLISGVTLLIDKSLKPGDIIEMEGMFGTVNVMGSRYTSIVTIEGKEYLVPNEYFISNQVVNWSHSNRLVRHSVDVGVSYHSDIHQVMALLEEASKDIERILKTPKVEVQLIGFGDSSVDFKVQFWVNDPQRGILNVKSALLIAIWDILLKNNIEIPFPQRDLHLRSGGSNIISES